MVANKKQQEVFIINDIEMEINPSDIQVMDDNWVMEDSYLRSKAVFCYRSKYSATKVVLNIPFQITYLTEEDKTDLNNTYNCIKLISELNAYPFCFIKNNRIKAYISPTNMSVTDYMIFAVDEIALVQDAAASNMVFLEVVLQYYNHTPLIQDFEFRSNLNVALNNQGMPYEDDTGAVVVNSLRDSEVWKKYMNPRVKKVLENLTESSLLDYTITNTKSAHPMMGVKILAPTMSVISEGIENVEDGRYVGKGTKVITVTDISKYDEGTFENLLATLSQQDFSFDSPKFVNTEKIQTINSEDRIKQGEIKTSKKEEKPKDKSESNEIINPFLKVAQEYKDQIKQSDTNKAKAKSTIPTGSKDVFIDWVGTDIQDLALGVNKIEIRRKNRLVTHQIGSYKHPIVQYLGKYPVNVNVTMSSVNYDIYKTSEPPVNVFIKQVLNVLDYNRIAIPEAETYNYIKIQSLATFLFDCEAFLPSQSVVSASANSQGLENIQYSFNESDLTEFVEQGRVEASGANSLDKSQEKIIDIIIQWLIGMPHSLVNILNSGDSNNNLTNIHILTIYKAIIELSKEAMSEMTMTGYPQYEAVTSAIDNSSDLKPGSNIIRKYRKIDTTYTKELSKYKLYKPYLEGQNVNVATESVLDSKYSGNASNIAYIKEAEKKRKEAKIEGISLTTLQLHNSLIPFMVYILKTRSNLQKGLGTTLPSVSYTPSGRFNNLALSIISKINSGIKEGAIVNEKALNNEEVKEVLENITEKYSKVFFGYNIEDLDYEILAPNAYNKLTDLIVPRIDPFFFIKEKTILNGNEFNQVYEKMYRDSNYNKDLLSNLNSVPSEETDKVDATVPNLQVTYRKLEEIDYIPLDTSQIYGDSIGFGTGLATNMGKVAGGAASAKKVSPQVSEAIEKALKKYGKDKDEGFRSYVYAVLLKESGNGTNMKSGTGAVGLFQFTYVAVKDLIQYSNNKLEYSNGGKVGYSANPSSNFVNQVKNASLTDLYLNAQMFIEKHIKEQYDGTKKGGVTDPVYSFIQHNIGRGGLNAVKAVLENGATSIPGEVRSLIRAQSASFIGSNDVQTVRNYYSHMAKAMSIDNVPSYNKINASDTVKSQADKLLDNLSEQNKKLTNSGTKAFIPFKKQQDAIDSANKAYQEASKSKEDKTTSNTISSKTVKGVVVSVTDGDTIVVKETKTNKTHNVRLYGLDTPESVSVKDLEIFGKNSKDALNALVNGKNVTVQLGGSTYERDVGLVKLADGTDVSLTMLRNGFGFVAEGFTVTGEYAKAENQAKQNQKGLWSYPDGVLTKPRSQNRVDLTKLSDNTLNNLKNNVNYEKFTEKDFEYAKKANANALNNFIPLGTEVKYRISAPFGEARTNDKGKSYRHTGIDLATYKVQGGTVIAAASGKATVINSGSSGYGLHVKIDHGNGFLSLYAHLRAASVANGASVMQGQKIGEVGNTGRSTGAHLHYEVRYNGTPVNPFGTKELALYKPGDNPSQMSNISNRVVSDEVPSLERTRKGVTEENTVFNEDKLADAIFENIYKNTNVGLKASLPSIKVYMTIGNENDKFWLDTLKGDILYYEIKGVKSFGMSCNNDSNPIDTAVISIADPSFLNTDGFAGISKMQGVNVNAIGLSEEMQFKNNRIQLKNGNKIQVRLGYGNDPNELEIVFNGSIVDLEIANQNLNLILEGYGKELLSDLLATEKPTFMNDQNDNISTASVIGEALVNETIEHFGYNSGFVSDKLRNSTDPEDRSLAPGRFSFSYNWFVDFTKASYKSRLFMNVFAPEIEKIDDEYSNYSGWITNIASWFSNHAGGYPFAVYKMTPWQCMKQMEYRHPNTICKPMLYEDRMTLFYGIKEQMYFKKDLTKALQISAADQKDTGIGFDLATYYNRRRERMAPVSNIHLVTSNNNLINNGLRLNSTYSTKVRVNYYEDRSDALGGKPWDLEVYDAKADDNLYPFDIRAKELTLSGCLSKYSAFLYGTEELKKEAEKMYQGKILIVGNPTLKAGDYVFLDDSDRRLHGLVLVRECYHHFNDKVGFVTEIVPGQYVEAANFMYSSLWLNLICACKIVTSKMKTVVGSNFSSEEFNMVSDYLTILRQAELEMDKVNSNPTDKEVAAIYAATVGLSAYLVNSLANTIGMSGKNSILKFAGVQYSSGAVGFSKNFYRIFVNRTDLWLLERTTSKITQLAKTQAGKASMWANKSSLDVRGIISQPKAIIASSKFMEKVNDIRANRSSGLVWRATKPMLGLGTKATIEAAKVTGRVLYSSMLAVTLSNPLTIALDIILFAAIQYGMAKVEENQLMRQPLLYFPIVRHGKPYVGGMAGVTRNSWLDSQKLEAGKTIKEVQKAASILVGNNDVTNLSGDRPFYISLMSGIASNSKQKTSAPLYQTDSEGNKIVVADNKVTNNKQLAADNKKKMASYLSDEEVMKQQLIQKMNTSSVGSYTNDI